MHRIICLLVLLVAGMPPALSPQGSSISIKVARKARSLQPGELVVVTAEASRPLSDLHADAFGHDFPLFTEDGGTNWTGLVGIDLDTRPGEYDLKLHGSDRQGAAAESIEKLAVVGKAFPTRSLTVDQKFVTPPPEAQKRIQEESERVRAILNSVDPQKYWRDAFMVPVPGAPISAFGKRSVYNRQTRSSHAGTDFRAATGTPIRAPNAGRIVLAAGLYYSGNTVIIDHGLGLFSYLGHMSSILVTQGSEVQTGQVVGKAGATGLVTGPHLHWAVRLAGTRIDPLSLLSLLGNL
jgi:murein DD-endopeptidase MepM/ murein hydrolase activator NlpD